MGTSQLLLPLLSSSFFAVVTADYVKCQLHVVYLLINRLYNSGGL